MQKIYIESTIPSYYTSKPSGDPIKRNWQIITKKFWNYATDFFDLYISTAVLFEIQRGNKEAAEARRLAVIPFKLLMVSSADDDLTEIYVKLLKLPENARADATHIAVACLHRMDYLITWNCNHIANGQNLKKIQDYNLKHKIHMPVLTTPELFLGGGKKDERLDN